MKNNINVTYLTPDEAAQLAESFEQSLNSEQESNLREILSAAGENSN